MSESYRTEVDHIETLEKLIGKELGSSPWFTITQARIQAFADATEDHQWIHLDRERSTKQSPYKTTIAHGFLILSLCPYLCAQTFAIKHKSMGINYGLDRVRFTHAVEADAAIRGRVSLLDFSKLPNGAKLKLLVTIDIKDIEKPACIAELISLVYNN